MVDLPAKQKDKERRRCRQKVSEGNLRQNRVISIHGNSLPQHRDTQIQSQAPPRIAVARRGASSHRGARPAAYTHDRREGFRKP